MTETPRLRSTFPVTPVHPARTRRTQEGQNGEHSSPFQTNSFAVKRLTVVGNKPQPNASPIIPFEVVDAPSQRIYAAAFYFGLVAWKIYDYWVSSEEDDATWLFLKWIILDGLYLFGLPALRIPWLEWAFSTTLAVFFVHAVMSVFMMFRIPIPMESWCIALVKLMYDRELSISGHRVKPGDILHNSSLILGKQVIHILPEGSAVLNPEQIPLCLNEMRPSASLHIRVNQTKPILIELLRFDFESGQNETIVVSEKQTKQLTKQAIKDRPKSNPKAPLDLIYPVKKIGAYRLKRVVDESKLGVQHRSVETLVVTCPKAVIKSLPVDKCRGDLSNLSMEVDGTPPFKIKYSRRVNNIDKGVSLQSIQPEKLDSTETPQINSGDASPELVPSFSWASRQKIQVPLNESLNTVGEWVYSIEQIHDGCGNVIDYIQDIEVDDRHQQKGSEQIQRFSVHELPRISLRGCDSQTYLQVAKGDSIDLPVQLQSTGTGFIEDFPYTISYSFTEDNDKTEPPSIHEVVLKSPNNKPRIKNPGWYSITGVSSQYCSGEVFEPSSCYLHNPTEPKLSIRSEKVYDTCANNSVGLTVYLEIIGTPPFRLRYSVEHSKGVQTKVKTIDGLHGQLDLRPAEEGHYKYQFLDLSDRIYEARSLKDSVPILEQDVKPPASARFVGPVTSRKACFGEPVSMDIMLAGEAPWILNYEVVHNGKRKKKEIKCENEVVTLVTDPLTDGGVYTVALTSVKDKSNCKRPLKEEIRIDARPKRPHVAFALLNKKRSILALEDKNIDLPLRLEGEPPWKVTYRNNDEPSAAVVEKTFWDANALLPVTKMGKYEIVEVSDATCPGSVDQNANIFDVSWIARPKIIELDGISIHNKITFKKDDVCEGDVNTLQLKLDGNRPYGITYEEHYRSEKGGPVAIRSKSLTAALDSVSVPMRTSGPGNYSYVFSELGDNLYTKKKSNPQITVNQRVNPRPSARFEAPNHIYGYCKEEDQEDEMIPIVLEGVPPFTLELAVKHHTSSKPEILSIPNINSNRYGLPVPRRYLDLGQHVLSIRKVRDSRGCQRTMEHDGPSVRVTISDVPSIIPLESRVDYCVGERISFSLSGHAPFEIYYTFDGVARKAKSQGTTFRRIAEAPGEFTINSVSDGASGRCRVHRNITKVIHGMPSVKISQGSVSVVDIPEGGEADILFEFWGTPPFEFTYTRSSNAGKGKKDTILDTKHDISYEHTKTIKASDEGTYEVVAIKDRHCSFSTLSSQRSK
ncbi:hypothetical protein FQN57_002167 [Myotisia sp. PD_48]|nr:hypothetical protein FQN57_002167 [Myotisia sp. PD_48]